MNKESPTFHTYILQNPQGRYYIGHTEDLERRLLEHNEGHGKGHLGKFTHRNGPWQLVWSEEHTSRPDAVKRERAIKSWKSAIRIRTKLIDSSVTASAKR